MKKIIFLVSKLTVIIGLVFIFFLYIFSVSAELKSEDIPYIEYYTEGIEINNFSEMSYEEEIELIGKVQSRVLEISPKGEVGIPKFQERRPRDLLIFGEGLCFDRSFTLELIFKDIGFSTRHVALYADIPNQNDLIDLTQRGISSHAVTEVKTKKGWLVVDSNKNWLALDSLNNPYSMKKIFKNKFSVNWLQDNNTRFYNEPSHFIYGLYSRHGKFHPPYNFIPDYNFYELFYNL